MIGRSKGLVAAATVSFLLLSIFAILSRTEQSDKVFGVDNFYVGTLGNETDPKVLYDEIQHNIIAEAILCGTVMQKANDPKTAGDIIWFADGETVTDASDLENLAAAEGDGFALKPFSHEGQAIVAPVKLKFANANIEQQVNGEIDIVANIQDQFQIVFKNVKSWWCHIGKLEQNKHTERIGKGGFQSSCDRGYIIGEAYRDTLVYLFRLDSSGERIESCSLKELTGWVERE